MSADASSLPSYTSAIAEQPLLGETIGANLERTVARWGDREALIDVPTHRRWTYSELDVEVDELALGLLTRGVAAGDRVGVWSPNCAEWVLLQYATAKIGAVLVNVNPAYRSHELAYVVNQSGLRLLVSAVRHRGSDYRGMVDQVRGECPGLQDIVHLGEPSWTELLDVTARRETTNAETTRGDVR